MSHSNISIFIPHVGCPCRCSFCNQFHITSEHVLPTEKDIDFAVKNALKSPKFRSKKGQIAFFGGSFTAIKPDLMLKFLEIGQKHIKLGNVKSIRISTRPDAINQEILDVLKQYGVESIELGAQSMFDDVLIANDRGHTAQDVINASKMIKENGFELGLQMMTGLYKSDFEKDLYTANEFVKLSPNTVRIYPTVILKNTKLNELYLNGEYKAFTIEEACSQGAELLKLFYENKINVIRFGLHSVDEESFVAGAFHPALSEIAQSFIYRDIFEKTFKTKGFYTVFVNENELSKAIGHKKSNLLYFKEKNILLEILPDKDVKKYEFKQKKG